MEALSYETLIRRAFGFKAGRMLDRQGDPAGLADTDRFVESNLPAVKVGVGYAVEILTTEIQNQRGDHISEKEHKRLDGFTSRVLAVQSLKEMAELIDEIRESIEDRYFQFDDGVMTLK